MPAYNIKHVCACILSWAVFAVSMFTFSVKLFFVLKHQHCCDLHKKDRRSLRAKYRASLDELASWGVLPTLGLMICMWTQADRRLAPRTDRSSARCGRDSHACGRRVRAQAHRGLHADPKPLLGLLRLRGELPIRPNPQPRPCARGSPRH